MCDSEVVKLITGLNVDRAICILQACPGLNFGNHRLIFTATKLTCTSWVFGLGSRSFCAKVALKAPHKIQ